MWARWWGSPRSITGRLFGAWYIVIDKTGGFSGKHYGYLESKLFPIALDRNYLVTLGLYAVFIILVELTLLVVVAPLARNALPRRCCCGTGRFS